MKQLVLLMKSRSLLLPFLVLPYWINCQNIEFGPSIGLSVYYGDLTSEGFNSVIQSTNMSFGAFFRLNLPSNFSFKLGGQYITISGDDANSTGLKNRGLNFRTELTEITLTAEWYFLRLGSSKYGGIYPYLYGGIGGFHFTPKAKLDGEFIELSDLGTEGQGLPGYPAKYSTFQPSIPIGTGVRIEMENFGAVIIELGARKTFTDYLDDVSGTEINYQDLLNGNGELAARLSNRRVDPEMVGSEEILYRRGSDEFNDWYYVLNLSLAIPIGSISKDRVRSSGVGCPKF